MMIVRLLILTALMGFPGIVQADELGDGQALYEQKCLPCHNPAGHNPAGTGTTMLGKRLGEENALLAERTDLNAPYIKAVLRNGIGSMTWYRRTEITDAQADALAAYLTRNNGGGQ